MAPFHIIIPAAGFGSRMDSATPKQYLTLAGEPVIAHTLKVFFDCAQAHTVHVLLNATDTIFAGLNCAKNPKLNIHYCGGGTRAQSVLNGLQAIKSSIAVDDWILVHDAARPCLSQDLLATLLDALQKDAVGGLLAIPLAETLKRSNGDNQVVKTEPRADLWQAQTPQMFRYGLLTQALQSFSHQFNDAPTDESQAIEALGYSPTLVRGDLRNIKITYPQDLALAELILRANKERIQ